MKMVSGLTDNTVLSDGALSKLQEKLQQRHHHSICCTLLYGSCLRSGDIFDGLIDLYLICDNYRKAYGRSFQSVGNWLLPPNVYYAELEHENRILRSKVTVISMRDFERGCSSAWFEPYIWGRFSQPSRIVFCRDEASKKQIERSLLQASGTLLRRTVPALPRYGTVESLWTRALSLSYSSELRAESKDRAAELVHYSLEYFIARTEYHANDLGFGFSLSDENGELSYRSAASIWQCKTCIWQWRMRRIQGKMLSILRLTKALFTFEGGLDYVAWKLERHSGQKIVIPDRVRRAPLLYCWGFFWSLYSRGLFK